MRSDHTVTAGMSVCLSLSLFLPRLLMFCFFSSCQRKILPLTGWIVWSFIKTPVQYGLMDSNNIRQLGTFFEVCVTSVTNYENHTVKLKPRQERNVKIPLTWGPDVLIIRSVLLI